MKMKELPLKKADERTLAQPNRLFFLYSIRCVPTALGALKKASALHGQSLH